jgi:hypothetical protein
VIAEILLLVWAGKAPRTIEFHLNDKGFEVVGQKFYPYAELDAWSADENEEGAWCKIIFRPRSRVRPAIQVSVPRARFVEICERLTALLPQKDWEPPLSDTLEKFLRF